MSYIDITGFSHYFLICFEEKVKLLLMPDRHCCHHSKTSMYPIIKWLPGINTKLKMTRGSCKTRGITLKGIFLELCPFFN